MEWTIDGRNGVRRFARVFCLRVWSYLCNEAGGDRIAPIGFRTAQFRLRSSAALCATMADADGWLAGWLRRARTAAGSM
jgi:hypothetical protein